MKRIKQTIKLAKKQALVCLAFGCLVIVFFFFLQVAWAEWREPAAAPPQENPYPPISIGAESQVKEGYLRLDSTYNPDNISGSVSYPLEVVGTGAKFIETVADDLEVADTLYVDKVNNRLGIGTATPTAMLSVVNGTVKIGISTDPVTGQAVNVYSSDNYAISGTTSAAESAGVYGITTNSEGYGVLGVTDSSGAGAKSGVYGSSVDGYGVYGRTDSYADAAVYGENTSLTSIGWAGYFDGSLGAGSDVVSTRFLPTNLQTSLIPFTSGQEVAVYDFGNWGSSYPDSGRMTFDGTYVWMVVSRPDNNSKNIFKIRASDGVTIDSYRIGFSWDYEDIVFDGQYFWLASLEKDMIYRFDPIDSSEATVSGLAAGDKYSLVVSSINGETYIWSANLDNNTVLKIKASDLSLETFDLSSLSGVSQPFHLAFDGTYIWVSTRNGGNIIRLWAENPNDGAHPMIAIDTASRGCDPYSVFFDGEYIWCLQSTSGYMLRIWPEDPYDPQHPMKSFGPNIDYQKDMAFDGTYLWTVGLTEQKIYRYLAADPNQEPSEFNLTFQPERILFDGTYIWVEESGNVPPKLHKYYSGTGLGHTDLNTVVNLNPAVSQAGNINITGSAEIGSEVTVGGDIDVAGNFWDGSDETVPVSGGSATCTNGSYIKGVIIDVAGKLDDGSIICRGL